MFMIYLFLLVLPIFSVHLEPIRVGRIEDMIPLEVADSPLKHQAERLETLRRKLNEKSRIRDEDLAEAEREYSGSKLFEASQRILSRLRGE